MTSPNIPHFSTVTVAGARILIDRSIDTQEDVVTLDSTNADAGNTPTHRMRAGNIVILRTSTGRYVEADDANADALTPATVSAIETADAGWQSTTITTTIRGGVSFDVVLGAGDDTDAEVVTALNANAVFAANCIADESGGFVRIRTLEAGAEAQLHVNSTLATAYGANGIADNGTDPDVRVMLELASLQDKEGTAINADANTARKGHFDESALIVGGAVASLTDQNYIEAKAVLLRRGSIFA